MFNSKVLIIALCLLTIGGTSLGNSPAEPLDHIVATVNEDLITANELSERITMTKRELKRQNAAVPDESTLKKQVLKQTITEQLLLQLAQRNNISIDDDELANAIEKMADDNHMTLARLKNNLRNNGINYDSFKDDLKRQMIIGKLQQQAFSGKISVSDAEVAHVLQSQKSHEDKLYHIAHILVPLESDPSAKVLDNTKSKAQKILTSFKADKDFKSLSVKAEHDDTFETSDLGFRHATQLPILFARTVTQMQPGQISELFRDESGFHIIQLVETRQDDTEETDIDVTREQIRQQLYQQKLQAAINQWINELRASASIEVRKTT